MPYEIKNREEKERKAILLHKEGLTTREIGKVLGRSRQWVSNVIKVAALSDKQQIEK